MTLRTFLAAALLALPLLAAPAAAQQKLPGTSHADAVLQRDTAHALMIHAGVVMRRHGCTSYGISQTQFLRIAGPPAPDVRPGRFANPWTEEWTVTGCGHALFYRIRFVPDRTGTRFDIKPDGGR